MDISTIPTITFHSPKAGWGVDVKGTIREGQPVHIVYDPSRLGPPDSFLRVDTGDGPSPVDIFANARFSPNQSTVTQQLYLGEDPPTSPVETTINVPFGARQLSLWAENDAMSEGRAYDKRVDSLFGQNFNFPVAPSETP